MQKVGSREFKNRLGRYLAAVRRGQSLVITDRGRAVAKLTPPDPDDAIDDEIEARLPQLHDQGLIRLPERRTRKSKKFKPIRAGGKPASQMIIEDRR